MSSDTYILLPSADEDLVESAQYLIENASDDVAERVVRSVFSMSHMFLHVPGVGIPCYFRRRSLRDVRRFPVEGFERWLVFYRPVAGRIEVVRVLHSSRDWQRLFR